MKTISVNCQFQSRRAFLQQGTLVLTAASMGTSMGAAVQIGATQACAHDTLPPGGVLRVGMMTDLHYADKPPSGTRHYRQTLVKLAEASKTLQSHQPDFIVELGDFIDAADSVDLELRYLATINQPFSAIAKDRHYVLGNHCVDTLTKEEFLAGVEQPKSFYSFDRKGIHFIILDACYRSDGVSYGRRNFQWTDPNIPPEQLEWLTADLQATGNPTIVFAHQRLDVSNSYGVKNAMAVRSILEASKKVSAVFQGHSHKNALTQIGGIFYCTQVAMVEGSGEMNNAFSLLEISPDGTIALRGFHQQENRDFKR